MFRQDNSTSLDIRLHDADIATFRQASRTVEAQYCVSTRWLEMKASERIDNGIVHDHD